MASTENLGRCGRCDGKRAIMQLSVNLQKRLSANFALDVKFSIPAGVTMLFGASGSGKTTLLRCVAGLIARTQAR